MLEMLETLSKITLKRIFTILKNHLHYFMGKYLRSDFLKNTFREYIFTKSVFDNESFLSIRNYRNTS